MFSMPETHGQPLPETIEEVERAAQHAARLRTAAPFSPFAERASTDNGEASSILHQEEQ